MRKTIAPLRTYTYKCGACGFDERVTFIKGEVIPDFRVCPKCHHAMKRIPPRTANHFHPTRKGRRTNAKDAC